jgi:hypothetical protein
MADRHVGDILAEWRAVEHELEDAADDVEREEIEARIFALRAEHVAAMAANDTEAKELGGREPERAGA